MRGILVAGALLAISGSARSAAAEHREAGERISLVEILASMGQRSPGFVIARSDREEGHQRLDAADAIDEWHLVARGGGQDAAVARELAGPDVALDTRSVTGEVGLQRNLPTGGKLEVAMGVGWVNYLYPAIGMLTGKSPDVAIGGVTATAKASLSHSLLRGAGSDVARADRETARLGARSLSAQAVDEGLALVRDLAIGYWELAYATEALAVDREAEALAAHQIGITSEVVKNGMQPPSAMKIAETQLALRQEAVLRDEATVGDQSLTVRKLAGLELVATPLVPTDAIETPGGDWTETDAVAAALAHGPGIAQKKLAQRGAEVAVGVASNATLPRLDASLNGEVGGVGGSTAEAVGRIGQAQTYTITGGLTLVWDLGSAAGAAEDGTRVHRARLDAERTQLDREVSAAALSAVRLLHSAKRRVELSQVGVDAAADALHSETVAYQSGRSTIVAVFQREDDVAQAKLRLARARIDAVEAAITIDYLTGSLLQRFGVTLAERRRHP